MKGWIRLTKYSLFTHQAKPGHRYPRVKSPKRREFNTKAREGHAKLTASWDTGCIKLYRKGGREKFDRIIKQKLHGRKKNRERKGKVGREKKKSQGPSEPGKRTGNTFPRKPACQDCCQLWERRLATSIVGSYEPQRG